MLTQKNLDIATVATARPMSFLYRQSSFVMALAFMLSLGFVGTAAATQSSSTHYQVNETQFGSGSSLHDCSTSYCAKTSVGDTTVGKASSTSYSAQLGSNTTDEPLLEVTATGGSQDMGTLDATHTGTATTIVKVRNYLSNGYVMQVTGAPPNQGTHTLTAIWPTASTSHQGAEQFGINLVANTTPSIGANPTEVLAGLGTGEVTDNYSTSDLFANQEGDVVAQSTSSSSEMTYTISMIINVSNVTPGGRYTGAFSAVVVPLY